MHDSDASEGPTGTYIQRQQEYAGKVFKCPKCGETLKSFESVCPICGYELRGAKASSIVREFSEQLDAIRAEKVYYSEIASKSFRRNQNEIFLAHMKHTERVAAFIQSFPIPNTKEDIIEFMILAASNINSSWAKNSLERAQNDAWISKFEQAYQKARLTLGDKSDFCEIQKIYDSNKKEIGRRRRRPAIRMVGILVAVFTVLCIEIWWIFNGIAKDETKHIDQLEHIVIEVQEALERDEYKHALRIADSIDYQRYDVEMERKWDIERKYWVDKVLEVASENGVELDYSPSNDIDNANKEPTDKSSGGGIISGFKEGVESGLDSAQENIDEFNRIMNDKE